MPAAEPVNYMVEVSALAAERESERAADLPHPIVVQPCQPPSDGAIGHRLNVMEVDGARQLHPIVGADDELGGNTSDR